MKKLSYSIIALLLSAGIVCFAVKFTAGQTADAEVPKVENVEKKSHVGKLVSTDKNPLLLVKVPQDVANQRINHMAYVCYFNKEHRIPNCVIYELSATEVAQCDAPGAERRKNYKFLADPKCPDSPDWYEYRGSGYDRGHMCPSGDNKWSEVAQRESFLLTNVCPQTHNLNAGDWNEMEQQCRRWAEQYGEIYVVCGPILYRQKHKTLGKSKVVVPEAFFKVVLCLGDNPKAVGFIYKNEDGNRPMGDYVNTVDQVERITGIDFFPTLPDSIESRIEAETTLL